MVVTSRPRRRAQVLALGLLCALTTGATAGVVVLGAAELDTTLPVTTPYTPAPGSGPLLVPSRGPASPPGAPGVPAPR